MNEPPDVTDVDRQALVDRIQQALAQDLIPFSDVDHRFEQVYAATTHGELELAATGLPPAIQPPPPRATRHLAPAAHFSLIGNLKLGGWIAVGSHLRSTTIIGDATVDLSSADIPPEGIELTVVTIIGSIRVIVPDGARIQLSTFTLLGDRKERLVPPATAGPTIRITQYAAIGNASVYSVSQLPAGRLRQLWSSLHRG